MKEQLQGVNLFLIGMMGSGKSTVGQLLAEQLRYRFFDSDVLIERVAGEPVTEIFAHQGEATFRELESQVLGQLAAQTRSVIATGGGDYFAASQLELSPPRHCDLVGCGSGDFSQSFARGSNPTFITTTGSPSAAKPVTRRSPTSLCPC